MPRKKKFFEKIVRRTDSPKVTKPEIEEEPKRPRACVGFHNGIGNWVMLTPALQVLSRHFGGPLGLVLDPSWEGEVRDAVVLMAENSPFIDSLVDRNSDWAESEGLYMSRHGLQNRIFFEMYKDALDLSLLPNWIDTFGHEIEFYLQELFFQFGIMRPAPKQFVPVGVSLDLGVDRYICLSNGFARTDDDMYGKKAWPHWQALVDAINRFFHLPVVLLGGTDDQPWGNSLHGNVINLTGKTNILETAAILKKAKAVVSTDTGVMHIADALEVPGVALFGPTLVSKSGPRNGSIIPLLSKKDCAPCQGTVFYPSCGGGCMELIPSDLVVAALRRLPEAIFS